MNASTSLVPVLNTLRSTEMQQQLKTFLPPTISADKFTEVTIAAIQSTPDVLNADKDSLYRACVEAARRGLLPDKREGVLAVFNTNIGAKDKPQWIKQVQFMPMVEGIIREMAKAGIKAFAVSVYANDKIRVWNDDDGQHVEHEPVTFGERGELVGALAAAKTEDGRPYIEAMSVADVMKIARRSKQCKIDQNGEIILGGTWKSDFERMAQKSALHRLRKRLPFVDQDAIETLKDIETTTDIGSAEKIDPQPPIDVSGKKESHKPSILTTLKEAAVQTGEPVASELELSDDDVF